MTDEEQKKVFAKNLNNQISKSGKLQKEIAKDLGISPTTFNTWCVGKILPRPSIIQKIADYFHIGKSDLLDDMSRIDEKRLTSAVRIPVLGRIAAGIPFDAVEEIIDWEEIPSQMASTGDYFALQIAGDSMEPKISKGDVVICRKQADADDGALVVALVNGNDACCKRLKKYKDGIIGLLSTNPAYEPMYFSTNDIDNIPVQILGVVKELRAKF